MIYFTIYQMKWGTIMTVFVLKLIAIITMLIDHTGAILFPDDYNYRIIGRLAFPIFAFLIAEGYAHTRDIKKYVSRIFIFAMISQIPYYIAFNPINYNVNEVTSYFVHDFNVLFTFVFAILAIFSYENLDKLSAILVVFFISFLAYTLNVDYVYYGVLLVFVFYIIKSKVGKIIGFFVVHVIYLWHSYGIILFTDGAFSINMFAFRDIQMALIMLTPLVSSIFILLYNGKPGSKNLKWFFYVFYSAHILILYLIKLYFFQ